MTGSSTLNGASTTHRYPSMHDSLEEMFPKKGSVYVAKCPGRVELVAVNMIPTFFCADGAFVRARVCVRARA